MTNRLYSISLAIGESLDLSEMLSLALSSFKDNLDLTGCAVLFLKNDSNGMLMFEKKYAVPDDIENDPLYHAAFSSLSGSSDIQDFSLYEKAGVLFSASLKDSSYVLFSLPFLGILLMTKKGDPFDESLLDSINPLLKKLSTAIAVCLQKSELSMVFDGTIEINNELAISRTELIARISEMTQVQTELNENKNHLALILQSLGEGIIVADHKGTVLLMNVKTLEYLDYMPESEANITLDQLFSNSSTGAEPLTAEKTSDSNYENPVEMIITGTHHKERYLRVSPFRLEGIIAGAPETIFLLQDISEEKEIDRLKNEFISNLSHELRTPMNAILGISKMLAGKNTENLNEQQKQGLTLIHDSGKLLLGLINNILDLSKIEAGKMEIRKDSFNTVILIEHINSLAASLSLHSVSFTLDITSKVPATLIGDVDRIYQVIVNILSNAFKFTEKGTVSLKIDYNENMLILTVADTGIGIASEDIPSIFERFRQGDGTASRQYQGTGIGLALCKELVTLMGGTISAESEQGKGTTVCVTIPASAGIVQQ